MKTRIFVLISVLHVIWAQNAVYKALDVFKRNQWAVNKQIKPELKKSMGFHS